MKEIYRFDGRALPAVPVPHDFIVKEIKPEKDSLVFFFEDDISYHDGVKENMPGVKSLIIRYHLPFGISDISLFKGRKTGRFLRKTAVYKEINLNKNSSALIELCTGDYKLEYLYLSFQFCQ